MTELYGVIDTEPELSGSVCGTVPEVVVNLVESGDRGRSLEFMIDGDRIGIRVEGDTEWQWMAFDSRNYEKLINKPYINYVELIGNKTLSDLGMDTLTENDIDNLF